MGDTSPTTAMSMEPIERFSLQNAFIYRTCVPSQGTNRKCCGNRASGPSNGARDGAGYVGKV